MIGGNEFQTEEAATLKASLRQVVLVQEMTSHAENKSSLTGLCI